jgi:hypothetical protein
LQGTKTLSADRKHHASGGKRELKLRGLLHSDKANRLSLGYLQSSLRLRVPS